MKYILGVWVVLIIGAGLWALATRPPSWLNMSELSFPSFPGNEKIEGVEASLDDSASQTIRETRLILQNSPGRGYRSRKGIEAEVIRVVDGDTIEVEVEGETMIVGYIGIEAPEVNHRMLGTEPFGEEALARNREIVEGKTVLLEKDIFESDREGRHLRYVYIGDLMVNALLLYEGLVQTDDSARALKYGEVIYELQNRAILQRRGGWKNTWPNTVIRY